MCLGNACTSAQHDAHLDEARGVARQAAFEPQQADGVAHSGLRLHQRRHVDAAVAAGQTGGEGRGKESQLRGRTGGSERLHAAPALETI